MNTGKEYFGHCNFDHGSKGMIAVPAQGSLLTVEESCVWRGEATPSQAPRLCLMICSLWAWERVSLVMPLTRSLFYWGNRKNNFGKAPVIQHWEWCFYPKQTLSNKLSLWTFRGNILEICSAPDWWDALCPLFSLQNVLKNERKEGHNTNS